MTHPTGGAGDPEPRLVRPYTLTAGRTDAAVDLPWEAPVAPATPALPWDWPSTDVRAQIMTVCAGRPSVAEIAAHLHLPLGVARVVVGDLVVQGYIAVHDTLSAAATADERRDLIGRTLRGLKAL
ncbi:DUF742 domain-containing protein [Mycolicibacterium sp. 018/SC-01/001]|uniref:DUF742 domain-containing protein n=1 Tax=Mycolicibacterium sp. 018/SC-01/001 TaxID=2592069 RepID=UPI00117C3001|nr:DUF742 domain-containing protein [Mycolicibacterium sp. 018/SC-01/001]TRW79844.1 DUF742 domain-containing protein [Mycolicibacterium sp. 018/SC-01/001]